MIYIKGFAFNEVWQKYNGASTELSADRRKL